MSDAQKALRLLALVLIVAAVAIIGPFWLPLLLAAWTADLLMPVVRRLQGVLGGRRRGAAAIVAMLVSTALVPIIGALTAAIAAVRDLLGQLKGVLEGRGTLGEVLLGGEAGSSHPTLREWADLASRHGPDAWHALSLVARASASVIVGLLVFITALYTFAASGPEGYRWLARHAPIPTRAFTRFARAFRETGRGLFVGAGGTALAQGLMATIVYAAIGIPRAMVLGPLTTVCALVPVVGTGLVWIPLAIELAATGDHARAAAVVVLGAGVHSLIDNFVRPLLTRYGRLRLPIVVVLVSMVGGISLFGAAGALLGPLIVRMTTEALGVLREKPNRPRPAASQVPSTEMSGHAPDDRGSPARVVLRRERPRTLGA